MITLRIHPDLFSALRAGFQASACDNDPPIKSKLISPLRLALVNADAKGPRGRLILVILGSRSRSCMPWETVSRSVAKATLA